MWVRLLADLVVVIHAAFILFVALGGLAALRWRRAPLLHLPAVVWGVFIELSGGVCPLTPLENALRRAAGDQGYAGGFIEHYLIPLVYPDALSPSVQLVLGVGVAVLNLLIYGCMGLLRRRGSDPSGGQKRGSRDRQR